MANTIRGRLEQEQERTSAEDEPIVMDIDLTASLIDKNLSEILCSLQSSTDAENASDNNDDQTTLFPSVPVKLTARRNQLTPAQATALIDFLLENGPTTIEETTLMPESDANETIIVDESPTSEETTIEEASTDKADAESTTPSADDTSAIENTDGEPKDTETVTVENGGNNDTAATTTTTTRIRPAFVSVQSLDLGWNQLGARSGGKELNAAVRKLLANPDQCPPELRLDVCGLHPQACRELAKGIVERHKTKTSGANNSIPPLSLNLACNDGIGDVGVAALAAAIRTVAAGDDKPKKRRKKRKSSKQESTKEESTTEEEKEEETTSPLPPKTILKRLDLSGCGIGDAGAQALAIALANNPLCVRDLDLSNNQITDQGAVALAQALEGENGLVERLDLSHNPKLGDAGAKALALAFEHDRISELILRSCKVRADGAACFGKALKNMGSRANTSSSTTTTTTRLIDLSGNPLGILSKTKKSGSKLSATALRSKATDTTKAYMNIIGKSLQKGLNSIQGTNGGMDTLESDDEEEAVMGETEEEDESRKKCAALSLAEAFIRDGNEEEKTTSDTTSTADNDSILSITLGFRHCGFDTRAAEALAAILYEAKEEYPGMQLTLDMAMNDVLEDEFIAALNGDDDDQLADMAEVYLDALEVMREARQRALEASRMAAARAKAMAEREAEWAAPPPSFGDDDDDDWGNQNDFHPPPNVYYDDQEYQDYSEDEW